MNLYCFIPDSQPSPPSTMGTPCARGVISSGQTMEAAMATVPPTKVTRAAVGVYRRQNTPSRRATTMGGVTAAVNAPLAA